MASDSMQNSVRHYENMRDSGIEWIGMVPGDWKLSTIGSVYQVRNTKVSDTDYPPLSVTMNGVVPQLATAAKTDAHDARKLVQSGDFVINSRSDRRGSCGISPYTGSVSLINTVLEPRERMNAQYYDWLFHTIQFADEFYKNGHGIVDDLWTTGWQEMKRIIIPMPSLDIQEKIAVFLNKKCDQIDSTISQSKTSIEEYKAWKSSIIYEAVTHGLDSNAEMKDSGVKWIGEMPGHWERTKISNCFTVIGSGTTPQSSDAAYYGGNVSWLQSGDLNGGIVSETAKTLTQAALNQYSALRIYKAPYIAIAMYGASIANASIIELDSCTNQACCVLSTPKKDFDLEYVFYAILSAKNELLISARGGTQPNISQDIIKRLLLPIPPLSEQKNIVRKLNQLTRSIDNLIKEKLYLIGDLESYKKSLIYEVVTGKRRVC